MAETTLLEQLAGFAARTNVDVLPQHVVAGMKQRVLDTLGVAVGAVPLETSSAVIGLARDQGGREDASAIGIRERLPATQAAFVNGVLAHSLDFDDTHLPSILHPSASVVPASLAAAQLTGASGGAVIAAIAAGLEICVRLGMAGTVDGTSLYFERGQHATSICGAIAGAASVAKLLGLEAGGIAHAMGIAVSMGSGVIEGNRTGGTVKRLHCGIAAASAVSAGALSARGITGPPTALEGRFGFFQAWLGGRFDAASLTGELGERWESDRIFVKPYPANHFTHAGIDAAIALRDRGLRIADIERITLGVPTSCVRTIGDPIGAKRTPATGYLAQFSGPYTVVAALMGGSGLGLGFEDFTDGAANDPERRALMARVDVEADEWCDAIYPNQFPAVLRIRMHGGVEIEERVATNRGGPERPLTDDELVAKFRDNAARSLSEDEVDAIQGAAMRLETLVSLDELLAPATLAK